MEYNKDLVLVFNMELVYRYIENGIRPIGHPKVHSKSKKIFFMFDRKSTQKIYDEYIKENNNMG